jgi:hypothetical protein
MKMGWGSWLGRSSALAGLSLVAACALADSSGDPSGELTATVGQAVQLDQFWFNQVVLTQDSSQAARATGAVYVPFKKNGAVETVTTPIWSFFNITYNIRGTCGVTFIAPHYAITASHCVSDANVGATPTEVAATRLDVKQFDITAANAGNLYYDSNLQGGWANYTTVGKRMDLEPGYVATDYPSCQISARCAFSGSSDVNCGFSGDVTLLYCPERANNAPWLPIASSDQGAGAPVEMYWFHELVNAPVTQQEAGSDTLANSLFQNYTTDHVDEHNWHYVGSPNNVLLPLHSVAWANGIARTRTSVDENYGPDGIAYWTDLFGCHGTSGSGVLQRDASGDLQLLGPVHHGNWGSTTDPETLCNPSTTQGQPSISYESNGLVNKLASKFRLALMRDRLAIVVVNPNLPVSISQ